MITYNHERYIRQALDSILMQKVDFSYEICLGEDESSDATRDICIGYAEKWPEIIRLFLRKRRDKERRKYFFSGMYNLIETLKRCRGKYVAILEGDDYWTDEFKLQKQVSLLEKHQEFSMCFTNSIIIDEDNKLLSDDRLGDTRKKNLALTDILSGLLPPTNTVVFRNPIFEKIVPQLKKVVNGDYLLFSILAKSGDALYMTDNTSAYRIHSKGAWSGSDATFQLENNYRTRKVLYELFGYKYDHILLPTLKDSYLDLKRIYMESGDKFKYYRLCLSYAILVARIKRDRLNVLYNCAIAFDNY